MAFWNAQFAFPFRGWLGPISLSATARPSDADRKSALMVCAPPTRVVFVQTLLQDLLQSCHGQFTRLHENRLLKSHIAPYAFWMTVREYTDSRIAGLLALLNESDNPHKVDPHLQHAARPQEEIWVENRFAAHVTSVMQKRGSRS
jgi:hypothetical protein